MELWRLTFKPWRACRLLLQIRFTLMRTRIRIYKVGSSSNCKVGYGSATLGVKLRIRNAVLTLSWALDRSGEGVPSEPGGRGGHHVRERGLQLALRIRPNTTACP
jgi:hypothetical protein